MQTAKSKRSAIAISGAASLSHGILHLGATCIITDNSDWVRCSILDLPRFTRFNDLLVVCGPQFVFLLQVRSARLNVCNS